MKSISKFIVAITFKHKINGQKKKIQGLLRLNESTVECLNNDKKQLKRFDYQHIDQIKTNNETMKMKFILVDKKKLTITFITNHSLTNLTSAESLINEKIKKTMKNKDNIVNEFVTFFARYFEKKDRDL